jgi:hypothetical protein
MCCTFSNTFENNPTTIQQQSNNNPTSKLRQYGLPNMLQNVHQIYASIVAKCATNLRQYVLPNVLHIKTM